MQKQGNLYNLSDEYQEMAQVESDDDTPQEVEDESDQEKPSQKNPLAESFKATFNGEIFLRTNNKSVSTHLRVRGDNVAPTEKRSRLGSRTNLHKVVNVATRSSTQDLQSGDTKTAARDPKTAIPSASSTLVESSHFKLSNAHTSESALSKEFSLQATRDRNKTTHARN